MAPSHMDADRGTPGRPARYAPSAIFSDALAGAQEPCNNAVGDSGVDALRDEAARQSEHATGASTSVGLAAWGRRWARLGSVLLPVLVLAWGGYLRRWIGDDGFINLRVVRQLLAGNGFVFNAGERAEAVTSPAWIAVLWLAGALGGRLEGAAWLLGLFCSVLGIALVGWAALASCDARTREQRWFLPFGLLVYACLPPAWDFTTSGLENGLGLTFLGASFALGSLATRDEARPRGSAAAAAFLLGCAPLIRPDFELLALPLLGLLCWQARGLGRKLALAGLGVSAGAGYEIFRMGYFASLVPNTALAKQAFDQRWTQGLRYLWNSVGLYWLIVPTFVLALALLLPRIEGSEESSHPPNAARAFSLCWFGAGLLHLAYVVSIGGDFMHGRMLLPGFFVLFSSVPVLSIGARGRESVLRAVCALAIYAWCVVCGGWLRVSAENQFGIGDERGWYARMAKVENPTHIEQYRKFNFYRDSATLRKALEERCSSLPAAPGAPARACRRVLMTSKLDGVLQDREAAAALDLAEAAAPAAVRAVVARRPLGISAAVLGLDVNLVDYYGLADPIGARLAITRRRRPGHEQSFDTVWQAARYAGLEATHDKRVLAARNALGCGQLAQLARAIREPLDSRRFLRNMQLAIESRNLRIPHDPQEAEQSLCAPELSRL
jgi:arabinofuranosyltransferase